MYNFIFVSVITQIDYDIKLFNFIIYNFLLIINLLFMFYIIFAK